jgi:hypothetical protein
LHPLPRNQKGKVPFQLRSLCGEITHSTVKFRLPLLLAAACFWAMTVPAAEWQWSVAVRNARTNSIASPRAFLWIPANCERLRGVVLAQHNMEEISILEHPRFRAALSKLNFAEIWVAPPYDPQFRFNEGAGETFNGMMADLATDSGYSELNFVPVVGLGHSAAASWPYYFAAWNPERTLAAISTSGQWPYFRNPVFAPDIWGDRNIDFIPSLETMGEYESAKTWSGEGLKERQEHPRMPLSMLACPGEGHFASSDAKAEFLAFYIRKAAEYRVPKDWRAVAAPMLIPIDPTKTGWLADKWRQDQASTAFTAPVGRYQGDPKEAFWFFDEETARAVEKYQAQHRGKKPQLVGFVQNGKLVEQRNTHQQVNLNFQPGADGLTFKLTGAFYETVPGGSPRPSGWTGLTNGSPLDHARVGSIVIERICGPFVKLGDDTFVLRFDRAGFGDGKRGCELWFAARHRGDSEFKPAVQQAQMVVPARNNEGAEQRIDFPALPDQKAKAKSLKLSATSDAGSKVCYYIREGPAEISGDTIRFTPIPPRATYPVKVTVVAWQYGSSSKPKLKTAESVERVFHLVK